MTYVHVPFSISVLTLFKFCKNWPNDGLLYQNQLPAM